MVPYINETLRLKFRNKIFIPLTRNFRAKKLKSSDFTIISNNCWGGTVYESYGLKKMSPTIGMFIMPEDYLKLVSDLRIYLDQPLEFISPVESKWKGILFNKANWGTYLIARIGDIELHMLHYKDEKIAKRKWESRVKRINWDRMIFKFNDQNGCNREHVNKFMSLELENKIMFVSKLEFCVDKNVILVKQPLALDDGIKASREPFGKSKYIDITEFINRIEVQ